jgi:hypothetical protein
MKTIKSFSLIFILALLLSSCALRSLHAFYTQDIIYFEPKFIGNWLDKENAEWSILSFGEFILKEDKKKNPSELSEESLEYYQKYKDGYIVNYHKDSTKTMLFAMPFKINNQLFLDFTPIEDHEMENLSNSLFKMHLIKTHSLAKLDMDSNNSASIKWLDEDKLKFLLNNDKIKIKHEKVGFDETILLTASSDELVKFIQKYMNSEDEEKWKTDTQFDLKRISE